MSNTCIPDEIAAQIRGFYLSESSVKGKGFINLFLKDWSFTFALVSGAKQQLCFKNNPGLIYFITNSKQIPILLFDGVSDRVAMGELELKSETKKKAKSLMFR